MPQSNLDAETTVALSEAEALRAMFESAGWAVAERVINEYIETYKDVTTITPGPDTAQIVRDRINTVATLRAIMSDLKGRVTNAQLFVSTQTVKSSMIERR